ncbi:metacaspase-2 isoform X3 [Hydra vulgaris]|uniref:metacaspase-2 isoform X3 n=1 Tax=Hydra vulgaris TaxID=6087 RepID=UPI0032EA1304
MKIFIPFLLFMKRRMKCQTTFLCFWLAFATQVSQVKILNGYEHDSVSTDNLMTNSTKRMTFPIPDEDDQDDSNQISNLLEVDPTDEEIDNIFDGINSPKNPDSDIQNSYKYKLPMTAFTKTIKENKNNDIDDDLDDKSSENNDEDLSSDNLSPRESVNNGIYNQQQHYGSLKFGISKINNVETNDQIRNYVDNDENYQNKELNPRDERNLDEKERYFINKEKKSREEEDEEEKEKNLNRYNQINSLKRHPLDEEYILRHDREPFQENFSPDDSVERSNQIYSTKKLVLMQMNNPIFKSSLNTEKIHPLHTARTNSFDAVNNDFFREFREQETRRNPYEHNIYHLNDHSLFSDSSKNNDDYHQSQERFDTKHHLNIQSLDKINNPLLLDEKLSNDDNNLGNFEESQENNVNNKLNNQKENNFDKSNNDNRLAINDNHMINNDNRKYNDMELSQSISRIINLIKNEYNMNDVRKDSENENQNLFDERQSSQENIKETGKLKKNNFRYEYLSQLYKLLEKFRSDNNQNLNNNNENSDRLLRKVSNEYLSSEPNQRESSRFKEDIHQFVYKRPFLKNNNIKEFQTIPNYGIADKINLDRLDASNDFLTKEINKIANNIGLLQMAKEKPVDSLSSEFTNDIKSHNSYDSSQGYYQRNQHNNFMPYDGQSDNIQSFQEMNKKPYQFDHKFAHKIKNSELFRDSLLRVKKLNHRPLDVNENEISNKKTRMYNYMPIPSLKDHDKESDDLRSNDQSRNNNAETVSYFKNRDEPSSFGESFNTKHHFQGEKIPSRNIIISGPALRKFNKNQEENDLLIRKDLDALNEKETKVAAYEALKDDEILKIAQKIADDSPSDKTDVINDEQKNGFRDADRKNLVPSTNRSSESSDLLIISGYKKNFLDPVTNKKATTNSTSSLYAQNIQHREYIFRVPVSLNKTSAESKRFHIHHIGDYVQRPDLMNNSVTSTQESLKKKEWDEKHSKSVNFKTSKVISVSKKENNNRRHLGDHIQRPDLAFNGITIPEDIAITNSIVNSLSSGKDIKHIAGIDHVRVKGHYGPYHFDESAGKPYRYEHHSYPRQWKKNIVLQNQSKSKFNNSFKSSFKSVHIQNVYHQNIYNISPDRIETHFHTLSQRIPNKDFYHPSYNRKNKLSSSYVVEKNVNNLNNNKDIAGMKGTDRIRVKMHHGNILFDQHAKSYRYGYHHHFFPKKFRNHKKSHNISVKHYLDNSAVNNNLPNRNLLRLEKKSSIKNNHDGKAYRRQIFTRVQHPHHLVIDNVPVHYNGQRFGNGEPEYILDQNYQVPARFRNYGRVPFSLANLQMTLLNNNIHGRGHSFDQLFQSVPNPPIPRQVFNHLIGERNPYKIEDSGEAIIASADPILERYNPGQEYYNGIDTNILLPIGKPFSLLNKNTKYGYTSNSIQVPTNDLVTEKILNYLSAGYDIKDNFNVAKGILSDQLAPPALFFKEQKRKELKSSSASNVANGNLDDGFNENFPDMEPILRGYHHHNHRQLSKHQKIKNNIHQSKSHDVSLDVSHVFDHEDSFNFAPSKGVVVPEKDARKIGLYDKDYLEKLGVWDDFKSHPSTWIDAILRDNDAWGTKGAFMAETRGFNSTLPSNLTICRVPADVAFLFDGSLGNENKEKYFNRYIEFAKQVVDYHPPSMQGYHYGAVVYSDTAELKFNFDLAYDVSGVLEGFEDIKRTFTSFKEGSRVDLGLQAIKELFDKSGRDWVSQVLIVLTDSKSTEGVEVIAQSLRDSTVSIFVIGLANKDSHSDIGQMEKIASQPTQHHVFQIDIKKLLGTNENVAYPQHLARVIPYKICRMNLAFVVDMKGSEVSRLSAIKDFIKTVTSDLGMGLYGSHVSVVGYGGKAKKSGWDFARFILCGSTPTCNLDRAEYLKSVDNLESEVGKESDAGSALEKVFGFYFDHSNNGQEYWNYLNVTVILTDRKLDGPYETVARKLRNHGVIIHAVGWLDANKGLARNTLAEAASDSDDFYLHTHTGILALENVARRMKQYFSLLLFGHESYKSKVIGGWEEAESKNLLKNVSKLENHRKVKSAKKKTKFHFSKKLQQTFSTIDSKKNLSTNVNGLSNLPGFWNDSNTIEKASDSANSLHSMLHAWKSHLFENETQYKKKILNKTVSSSENKDKELLWSISDDSILRHKLLQQLIKSFQINDKSKTESLKDVDVHATSSKVLQASNDTIDKLINKGGDDEISKKLNEQFEKF